MTILAILTAAAPRGLAQAPDLSIPWARIALGLLFCLGLAVIAILLIRQRQGLPTGVADLRQALTPGATVALGGTLQIEQRIRVTPTSQFVILRCAERRYLVHLGAQGAQLLDRLDNAASTQVQA